MGIVDLSAAEKVNTSLNLLRKGVKHILQEDKRFIKVSPNHVGVKNYSSGIVQSAAVDRAKISEQEFSPNRRKYVIIPTNISAFFKIALLT